MGKDPLLAAMRALQEKVNGITGTAVASRDGLIVRADTGGVDPDNLAALAATWLSLAQRMSSEAGHGTLREAMTRSSGGAVTIYAVGTQAVLVLIGDEGLDTARLRRESQATLDTIKELLTDAALGECQAPLPEPLGAAFRGTLCRWQCSHCGAHHEHDRRRSSDRWLSVAT